MLQLAAAKIALSRIPWKWLGIGLLIAAILVQTIRLERSERRADKAQFSLNEARQALKDLAEQSRKQQAETSRRIDKVVKRDDSEARRIENAALPGNCRTSPEIMGANL